ncbi:MAG: flagellar basal-body MS-ring/collar protein FliF [Myxococcota bacterium]|nr:flagellar basal-body MS-ring/collar protein FliF [Myxococcota bacterium]
MAEQQDPKPPDVIAKIMQDLRQFWERLPKRVRVLMVGVVILVVAASVTLATLDRTERKVLYTDLAEEDAAAIVTYLKGQNTPYWLEGGGTTILVPSERVHDTRLALAAEGIPVGGGVGFELFDEQRFGMTEFEERVSLRRALEGELVRTISKLESVRTARVHLVLPKRSILGSQTTPAQASIVVEMQRGRELPKSAIRSVIHLVSSSVEGLNPDQVTVVDTRGRLLSGEAGGGIDDKELAYQRKFEREMELHLYEMLSQILGPEASVVRVAANFDFSKRESTEERYNPEGTVVRSEQREVETVGSKATGAGGTPGTRSNLPGGTPPATSAAGQTKKREAETRNYEVDRVVNRTVGAGAKLSRISVAVLVNGKNKTEEPFAPKSPEELHQIELAVRGAVGFEAARGDSVEVQSVPFHVPEKMDEPAPTGPPLWKEWLPIATGLAVAIALIIAALSLRRKREQVPVPMEALSLPRPVHELEAIIEQPNTAGAEAKPSGEKELEQGPGPAALIGEVRQFFMDESEGASRILRSWLSDARKAEEQQKEAH